MASSSSSPLKSPVLSARHITKTFQTPEGADLTVLDNISLDIHEGEIVALLGRSGSGKSTLLRSLLGLLRPTAGEVWYQNKLITGPVPGMAMVFQNFALFPWLTVKQNVELGLEALGISRKERHTRALEAIDLIGLDGFESAFPKELSGGMRQRVGFARALVTNPDILFMDEPFSALDVLTSETLRSELLDLFLQKRVPVRAIVLVTHNIEEAVMMANRVVVLAPDPGRIYAEITVDLPYPRARKGEESKDLIEHIYHIMTTKQDVEKVERIQAGADRASIGYRLPPANINAILGLLDRVKAADYEREDLPRLAQDMNLEVDDLFPLLDAVDLLQFATVKEGDITLTAAGRAFATSDVQQQKVFYARALHKRVPLVLHILQEIQNSTTGRMSEEHFLRDLEDFMSETDAKKVFATAVDWGRFAELFEYNYSTGVLYLENLAENQSP